VAAAETLLQLLSDAFARKSWHGPNLRGSVRGLTLAEASAPVGRAGHCIADIVVHCAYWKYVVRRRLRGEKRGSFPLKGSNWFTLPTPLTADAWRQYVRLLEEQHAALCDAAAALSARALAATPRGSTVSNLKLIHGAALHDVYHAGQIQMIKGLRE
jgi:uncharacterized damage-inducible protein DinB